MKTIAILCGRYLPGYKDGGPVRTIVNLVECLGNDYHFIIITNDRDHGDSKPYKNIIYNKPNKVGQADVYYLNPGGFTLSAIERLTKKADLIYVCGPYDNYAVKTLLLKRIGRIPQPVVVASMGSFSEGAYNIKKYKKSIFINICNILGLFKKIVWSVTTKIEEADVCHVIGKNAKCFIAEDLPEKVPPLNKRNNSDNLKIIFLSRICKMKNLLYAIEVLNNISANIEFDIYGIIEDVEYWNICQKELYRLKKNVTWKYRGVVAPEKVIEVFSKYDLFLFPTLGENYGHVIFEALAGGCLPIISDRTPWMDLEEKDCGYVIPLSKRERYEEVINMFFEFSVEEVNNKREKAYLYASQKYDKSVTNTGYRIIFDKLAGDNNIS